MAITTEKQPAHVLRRPSAAPEGVWLTLLVAAPFSSLGNGLIRPALTSLITQQVGRSEQRVVLGLNQSLMSIAQIVGPAIAGALIDRGWLSTWAFWTALITVVALVLNRNAREARHAAANSLERA